jgi:hypothetical protein
LSLLTFFKISQYQKLFLHNNFTFSIINIYLTFWGLYLFLIFISIKNFLLILFPKLVLYSQKLLFFKIFLILNFLILRKKYNCGNIWIRNRVFFYKNNANLENLSSFYLILFISLIKSIKNILLIWLKIKIF